MKFLEINQYSAGYYVPKSKEDIKVDERRKYLKRLYYGKGLIDIDSIVTVEPEGRYDEETLEFTHNIYCIYFKNSNTKVYTDDGGYDLIKECCLNENDNSKFIGLQ